MVRHGLAVREHGVRATRGAVLACLAAAALLPAGCSGSGDPTPPSRTRGASRAPIAGTSASPGFFTTTDVSFAQNMIRHHRQAVEMADLAETKAGAREVAGLAGRVRMAQQPEISLMTDLLTSWHRPVPPAGGSDSGHGDRPGDAPGTLSGDEIARLKAAATGRDFDRRFLEMMARHAQGAISLARDEVAAGGNPAAKARARQIIANQRAEIDEMTRLLDRL
ncbi:DUF305 domain-containing protein [Rhizomonospora bruguierae]|uniref:DUF305 domain-containing protein n=1 Tax=Rhizomonospora bruguierae TaxID=1581705 RepID=UPI001BCE90E9|nr:DUF305 domain-containing protein [Micromonospora sp. NBRC 107566]